MELQVRNQPTDIINAISVIPDDQLKELLDHVTRENLKRVLIKVQQHELLMNDMKKELESNRAELEQVKTSTQKVIEKNNYFNETRESEDYLNLSNLGRKIIPTISNYRMKKLLRFAKIMQIYTDVPYANFLEGKNSLVKQVKGIAENGHEYLNYKYHAARTWKIIDNKLEECGLLMEFKTQKNTSDLHYFIDTYCK